MQASDRFEWVAQREDIDSHQIANILLDLMELEAAVGVLEDRPYAIFGIC